MDLQGSSLGPPLCTHVEERLASIFTFPVLSLSPEQFLGLNLLPKQLQASHLSSAENLRSLLLVYCRNYTGAKTMKSNSLSTRR